MKDRIWAPFFWMCLGTFILTATQYAEAQLAAAPTPPAPTITDAAIQALQAQRNAAQDQAAGLAAQLQISNTELNALRAEAKTRQDADAKAAKAKADAEAKAKAESEKKSEPEPQK